MHRANMLLNVLLIGALGSLFIPLTAYSQVHVGLVGGVNVATLTDEDPDVVNVSSRTSFSLGGVVEVALGRGFSLRAEPTFLRKGAVETVSEDGITGENEFLFSYLEVPLLLSYTFGAGAQAESSNYFKKYHLPIGTPRRLSCSTSAFAPEIFIDTTRRKRIHHA